ncbi:signal recognition particle receptor beta subunit-domain-containing protein [Gamsiella multidivaricata]|uniref:signal recognition particle receptor beta subunit-domain-containing protein n=1 Tax=Gamsiella multidivaricata TaxID=101098 RepID=UPI00221F9B59|nr:signal recognition particle receptor beta subunit-domain-containing protein [Gamsiella multidivaricata]KAI7817796.1 signal recognition particle receptor beta subunit-domain-containing protein [Gamsiella multidivaricata]
MATSTLKNLIPQQFIIANNEYLTLLVLLSLIALVGIAVNFSIGRKRNSKNTILLTGLPFAGKTAIHYMINFDKNVETVTSIKENEADVVLTEGKSPIHIVDIPGHERLRFKFSEFMPIARAVVFVVDSSTVARQTRILAEYLYDILADKFAQSERMPVLIACNKSDLLTSFKKERIQSLLEVEINKLRQTRTAALDTQGSEGNENVFLGFEGKNFSFQDLENEVEFIECSAENKDIESIKDWMAAVSS